MSLRTHRALRDVSGNACKAIAVAEVPLIGAQVPIRGIGLSGTLSTVSLPKLKALSLVPLRHPGNHYRLRNSSRQWTTSLAIIPRLRLALSCLISQPRNPRNLMLLSGLLWSWVRAYSAASMSSQSTSVGWPRRPWTQSRGSCSLRSSRDAGSTPHEGAGWPRLYRVHPHGDLSSVLINGLRHRVHRVLNTLMLC